MPRYAASRTLPAPVEAVWEALADPARLADWWPGVRAVDPGRRGLVPGGLWRIEGEGRSGSFRRPGPTGNLLVLEVVPLRRVAFQLVDERIDAELELEPGGEAGAEGSTQSTLVVEGPWLGVVRRRYPVQALTRLAALVRSASE